MKGTPSAFLGDHGVRVRPPRSRATMTDWRLAGTVQATVRAVRLDVLTLGVAAEIGAVDLHSAGQAAASGSAPIASRSLWARTKAVLYWTSRSRPSWRALMPFTAFTKMAMAAR